jgi:hypothetical protein
LEFSNFVVGSFLASHVGNKIFSVQLSILDIAVCIKRTMRQQQPEYNVWVICRLLDELVNADGTSAEDARDAARYSHDFRLRAPELNTAPDGLDPRPAISLLTIDECNVARLCSLSLLLPQPARGVRMVNYWDEVTDVCEEIKRLGSPPAQKWMTIELPKPSA